MRHGGKCSSSDKWQRLVNFELDYPRGHEQLGAQDLGIALKKSKSFIKKIILISNCKLQMKDKLEMGDKRKKKATLKIRKNEKFNYDN